MSRRLSQTVGGSMTEVAAATVDLLLRTHAAGYLLVDIELVIHAIRGKPPAFIGAPSVGACLSGDFSRTNRERSSTPCAG